MKLETRKLRAADVFRGRGDPRHYLNGIHINKNYIEASDGHTAIRMDSGMKTRIDVIIRFKGSIPKTAVKTKLSFDGSQSVAYHYDIHCALLSVQLFDLIDGKFPNLDKLIADRKTKGEMPALQPAYLARIDRAFPSSKNGFVYTKPISYASNESVQYEVGPSGLNEEFGNPIILIMPTRE